MAINGISGVNSNLIISSYSSQQVAGQEAVNDAVQEVTISQQNSAASQQSTALDGLSGAIASNAVDALVQANNTQAMGDAQLIASAAQNSNMNIYGPNKETGNQQQQLLDLTNNAAKAANTAVVQINLLA